jgi:hypothetical protein
VKWLAAKSPPYGLGVKILLLFNVAEGSLTVTYPFVAPVGIVAVM